MKKTAIFILFLAFNLTMFAERHNVWINGIAYELYYGDGKGAIAIVHPNINTNGDTLYYSGEVNIPSSIKWDGWNWTVKTIGMYAFANCDQLTGLSIPSTVEELEHAAIYNCPKLSRISYDPFRVTNIAPYNFAQCPLLTNPIVGEQVFIYMPKSYKGKYTIPNGITNITVGAFRDCKQITSIELPRSLQAIDFEAFANCTALKSINFPSDLTIIGSSSFSGCISLETVDMPTNIKTIRSNAFQNCTSLKKVTFNSEPKECGSAFVGCSSLKEIHVPFKDLGPIYSGNVKQIRQERAQKYWINATHGNNATIIMAEPDYVDVVHGVAPTDSRIFTDYGVFGKIIYDNGKSKTKAVGVFSATGALNYPELYIQIGTSDEYYLVERNTLREYKGKDVSQYSHKAQGDGFVAFFTIK